MWCWRRLLRVLWTIRISNQSILKEINPEYALEELMLKLKLWYFGHLKSWLMGKDPDVGKDWEQKENGATENEMIGWRHWLNGHEFQQTQGDSKGQGRLVCCSPWCLKELDTTEWLNNMPALQLLGFRPKLLSRFSRVWLCATPETAAHQAFPSLGFSRQEHQSGLPFPSPMHESEKWKWTRSVVSDSSDPMDYSPPGFSIHGIFQAKVLEWGAIAFSAT